MRPTPILSLLGASAGLSTKLQVRQLVDLEAELFGKTAAALLARYREGQELGQSPLRPGEGIASSVPPALQFEAAATVLHDAQAWIMTEVFHVEQSRLVRCQRTQARTVGTFVDQLPPGLVPDDPAR